MRKYLIAFLLVLSLLTGCLFGAQAGSLSRAEVYEALQEELRCYLEGEESMPLEELVIQLGELGNYKKSAFFSYYAAILRDTELEVFDNLLLYTELIRLDGDFSTLLVEAELPSVDEVEAYALGRQAEAAKDWPAAIVYYQKSIAVLDSLNRLAGLRLAGPTATPTPVPTPTPTPTPKPTQKPAPTPAPTVKPTAAPTPAPQVRKVCRVTAESARARAGAGTEFEVVGYVFRGERYDVLAEAAASNGRVWYLVNVDGVQGWISSGVTEISSVSSAGGAAASGSGKGHPVGAVCRIIAQEARARAGAGTEYGVLEYVREGQTYLIQDTATAANGRQWYCIVVDGTACWISSGVAEVN